MKFYRVFPWDSQSLDDRQGAPLYVPRWHQGSSRHDIPKQDGVLYASRHKVSAIAERFQRLRGIALSENEFWHHDHRLALAEIDLDETLALVDLTDPQILVAKKIDLASVITRDRALSQQLARRMYQEGAAGLLWNSSLHALWTNVSLFESRVKSHITVSATPTPLTFDLPEVQQAAKVLALLLPKSTK